MVLSHEELVLQEKRTLLILGLHATIFGNFGYKC